jgi:hypothetical protein
LASSLRVCRKEDFNFCTPGSVVESVSLLCEYLCLGLEVWDAAEDDAPVLCGFPALIGPISQSLGDLEERLLRERMMYVVHVVEIRFYKSATSM